MAGRLNRRVLVRAVLVGMAQAGLAVASGVTLGMVMSGPPVAMVVRVAAAVALVVSVPVGALWGAGWVLANRWCRDRLRRRLVAEARQARQGAGAGRAVSS